jgi:competence protein ComEC
MKNANDSSLITAMVWNGYNVLFLADMSKDTEKELNDHWIAADVIKVAHHGSRFTTENEFLSKTRPGLAVISVGKNNYGHPSSELIERIEKFNARIMRTDIDGCVLVSLDSSGIFASAYNSPE